MIHLEHVSKVYPRAQGEVRALDSIALDVAAGDFVAIKGPSGSGKSTLLLTIGGMVRPTSGRVVVADTDLCALSGRARARFRAEHIGFVFQMFHLVPYLTVLENVLLPILTDAPSRGTRERALALLERFGMAARTEHKPAELSTGERQRVAMARALLNQPRLILADEPTGNLDPDNAAEVMAYLDEFHQGGGTVLMVTHEQVAEGHAQRTILIRDGKLQEDASPGGKDG